MSRNAQDFEVRVSLCYTLVKVLSTRKGPSRGLFQIFCKLSRTFDDSFMCMSPYRLLSPSCPTLPGPGGGCTLHTNTSAPIFHNCAPQTTTQNIPESSSGNNLSRDSLILSLVSNFQHCLWKHNVKFIGDIVIKAELMD